MRATQEGLIVTFFFYGWGALHYFLAALTLAKDLRKAALSAARPKPSPLPAGRSAKPGG